VDWPEKKGLKNLEAFYKYFGDTDHSKRSDKLQARLAATERSIRISS